MKKVRITYKTAPLDKLEEIEASVVIDGMQDSVYEKIKKCIEIGDVARLHSNLFHWHYLLESTLDHIEDMKGQLYMFGSIKSIEIVEQEGSS